MRMALFLSIALFLTLTQGCEEEAPRAADMPTRLVVQITVDQLAASITTRQADRFEVGGFARLMKGGAWFPEVLHPQAHTETAVGHATLATGAYPSSHGIIGNSWYARDQRRLIKAFESGETLVCGRESGGGGPAQLMVDTIGDKLHQASGGEAKVFSVSGKLRSGVAMGGKNGKAFWYDGPSKGLVTSEFYFEDCPAWVETWHARDTETPTFDRYQGQQWTLSRPEGDYRFDGGNRFEDKDSPAEANMEALEGMGFGRAFPHAYGTGDLYYQVLTSSPGLGELIADFALELVRSEGLGQDAVPDYLSISFSGNDYVLHLFGPSSRESEDIIFQLDRTLARLFAALDVQVGADNLLIVLSGDHGAPEYPVIIRTRDGGDAQWIAKRATEAAVEAAFDGRAWPSALVSSYKLPYLYLDHSMIEELGLDPDRVLGVVETAVEGIQGVKEVVRTAGLTEASENDFARRILWNQNPGRSGDLYVVRNRYWQQSNPSGPFDLVQHGSPWDYDSYVPLGISGPGVAPGVYKREGVRSVDVHPTLAVFLGTKPGDEVAGTALREIFATPPE